MRSIGVEEEFLLVDEASGLPRAVAASILSAGAAGADPHVPGAIEAELQQQQIEINTRPHDSLEALGTDVRAWRTELDARAQQAGTRAAAIATSPLPVAPETTLKRRYRRMAEQFGQVEREQLTCGCHVHVSVGSGEEAVAILDRIRVWLPVLAALGANSPFWNGLDTGYSSYRAQLWGRWPSAGPLEVLGAEAAYRRLVRDLLRTGVLMDDGMVYFDARLSSTYPTVEVRVADVCLTVDDTVLLAGLVRGLADTAVADWQAGHCPPEVPAALVRAAAWRASRSGLDDVLVHPVSLVPRPVAEVVKALLNHVQPALEDNGDADLVHVLTDRLLREGNGAQQQRAVFQRAASLAEVVRVAAAATHRPDTF